VAKSKTYTDLDGRVFGLATLAPDEAALVEKLQKYAKEHPDWFEYGNYWIAEFAKFRDKRGLTRRETIQTTAYRIGQDLESRIGLATGMVRQSDYRDELELLIGTKFDTRREFCEATGLSEDMLSHVLAKRKHLAIDTLADALARIGYTIRIAPLPDVR